MKAPAYLCENGDSIAKLMTQRDDIRTESLRPRTPHAEWLIDEAIRDWFPASYPPSASQPGSMRIHGMQNRLATRTDSSDDRWRSQRLRVLPYSCHATSRGSSLTP